MSLVPDPYAGLPAAKRITAIMMHPPNSCRPLFSLAAAGLLTLSLVACADTSPGGVDAAPIAPNASTGPGNAFAPGSGEAGADVGFPNNGGGNGANAPGH